MHCLIYIDVLFMLNFIMDYIVISLSASLTGNRTKVLAGSGRISFISQDAVIFRLRKTAASLIGSSWVCIVLIFRLKGVLWDIVSYFAVSVIMALTMAGFRKWREIARYVAAMYFLTCALGGMMHVIYYYTAFGFMIRTAGNGTGAAKLLPVITSAVIIAPVIQAVAVYISGTVSDRKLMPVIIIENNGRTVRLKALIDTGNSLTDPFNGDAVNIIEAESASRLIRSFTEDCYHLIPFASIGEDNGLIPVVRFDRMIITGEQHCLIETPLFALYSGKFTDGSYRAILNPKMLAG